MNLVLGKPRVLAYGWVAVCMFTLAIPQTASARLIPGEKTVTKRMQKRGAVARRKKRRRSRRSRRRARRRAKRRAKRYFRKAEQRFAETRYNDALELYSKAYRSWPVPALLFNIGQCHRKMGQYEKAIRYYQKFLDRAKNPARRRIVSRVLRQTKELLAARQFQQRGREKLRQIRKGLTPAQRKKLALQVKQLDAERRRLEEKRRKIEVELRVREEMLRRLLRLGIQGESWRLPPGVQPPPVADQPRKKKRRAPFYKKWWFWTSIAVGVAAAVGTGVGVALWPREKTILPSGSLGTYDRR